MNKVKTQEIYGLFLWNDSINDMLDVVVAIFEVCHLPNTECINTMQLAHESGRALIKTGALDELDILAERLKARNLTITIEVMSGDKISV